MNSGNFIVQLKSWKITVSKIIVTVSHWTKLSGHQYIIAPPWMFLPLDLIFDYWIEHVTFGLVCVRFIFSTRIYYRGVPDLATDCPCGVWCHGFITGSCMLVHVLEIYSCSGFVNLTKWRTTFPLFLIRFVYYVFTYILMCLETMIPYLPDFHVSSSASFLQSPLVLFIYIDVVFTFSIDYSIIFRVDTTHVVALTRPSH